MAFKKLRVWPMIGKPKEPGGSLLELFLMRKYRGRRKRGKAKGISGFILLARNFGAVLNSTSNSSNLSSSKGSYFPPNLQHKASTYSTHVTSMSLQVDWGPSPIQSWLLAEAGCWEYECSGKNLPHLLRFCRACLMEIYLISRHFLHHGLKLCKVIRLNMQFNLYSIDFLVSSFQRIIQSSYVLRLDFWQHLAKSKDVSSDTNLLQVKLEPLSITIVNDEGGSWENRRRNYTFKAC
ncbi:hypothetical protein NC653_026800 [Populus alba x Populus x berolinensis]|uniref:Uncharacterized protein n=1 Tax=Populus alba x Populus x berolinensis TaxID=444605 RepID=A0AAD6M481_9ROSI|nr:hypothetical protein NC653_026800 [Populus alba x Populus x berolinensis]